MENEYRARLKDVSVDYFSGETSITFTIRSNPTETADVLKAIKDKELKVGFEEFIESKSLNANSYFHLLCRKIGSHKDVRRTEAYVKNRLISRGGVPELMDDGSYFLVVSEIEPEKMWETELLHLKPYGTEFDEDGNLKYRYIAMRGTHTYNKKEMSALIAEAVIEAKELGIETIPPAELFRLVDMWRARKS